MWAPSALSLWALAAAAAAAAAAGGAGRAAGGAGRAAGGAGRALLLFPFPMRSHGLLGRGYVEALLEAGFEVTYITPYPSNSSRPRLEEVEISSVISALPPNEITIESVMSGTGPSERGGQARLAEVARRALLHPRVRALLADGARRYDLLVAEWMGTELYAGVAAVFDCPYIWSVSVEPHWMVLRLMGETPNPAYAADFRHDSVAPLSFAERVYGLYWQMWTGAMYWVRMKMWDEPMYQSIFEPLVRLRGRALPEYARLRRNASMLLCNAHEALGAPLALPASVRLVGGYHLPPRPLPLPQDLKQIMDSSKDGVILFSMGSHLQSAQWPGRVRRGLLRVLGALPLTVLWKYEGELSDLPANIRLLPWAPQASILSHPKCRLFISHGGQLSVLEAAAYGVPLVGVPVFADQGINVARATKAGFAIKVSLDHDLPEQLKKAINEILTNSSYLAAAGSRAALLAAAEPPRRRLRRALLAAALSRGAPHLRAAALDAPLHQRLYLDLAALLLLALAACYCLVSRLIAFYKNRKSFKGDLKRS